MHWLASRDISYKTGAFVLGVLAGNPGCKSTTYSGNEVNGGQAGASASEVAATGGWGTEGLGDQQGTGGDQHTSGTQGTSGTPHAGNGQGTGATQGTGAAQGTGATTQGPGGTQGTGGIQGTTGGAPDTGGGPGTGGDGESGGRTTGGISAVGGAQGGLGDLGGRGGTDFEGTTHDDAGSGGAGTGAAPAIGGDTNEAGSGGAPTGGVGGGTLGGTGTGAEGGSGAVCAATEQLCGESCIPAQDCCTESDCPTGARCEGGECHCPTGTHQCGDACVSDTDPETCGQSCDPCVPPMGGTATCDGTQCLAQCSEGRQLCAGECIAVDAACTGECPSGTHNCSELCVDDDSVNGCGDSCTPCRVPAHGVATCEGGQCGFECTAEPNYEPCGSACIPTTSCCEDAECGTDRVCDGGTCQCAAGLEPCGEACIPAGGCCQDGDCEGEATCNGSHQCVCDAYYYGSGCDHYFRALGYSASNHSEGEATAVSADGNVVVGWSKPSVGDPEAFRWENGVNEGLGMLADAISSTAVAVSGDGSVVVGNSEVVDGAGLVASIAFRWVEGGGISSLGVLSYGTYSFAWDVSRDGQVVCGDGDYDGEPRGVRWVGGTPTSMQYDFDPFWALGANQDGSILVGKWFNYPAVVSFSGSDATPSNLPLGGSTSGAAVAVSDDGQTVLGWLDAEDQAYLWSGSGSPQELGDFLPWDLSGNGAVAVGESPERVAVLWDASHGLRTLSDVLTAAGVSIENWSLWRATGVSADGKTIVGSGSNGSRTEGFIVRLP